MAQYQTNIAQLTKNMMITDLMKTTGWTKDRAISAIEELEKSQLIYFLETGGLELQVIGVL
ncbi:hypothetical protein [Streptococcus pluranimalium]|uniref:Uncharacterized protein n=1 Tax=Streptococcus pluranimalium TaxID=82348 RepID=A0A345VJB2_9STRE|nr:hypothetical protein [Streptococcus pluranimalium]AXJ12814.1 hypothetical protein Sp14A_08930 [Streptococcus pluranimalium]